MIELPSRFPQPLDDDDDDVAWALQTAQVQWKRGGQADAIVWLRRAAESADALGLVWRAADVRRAADELTVELASFVPAPSRPPVSIGGGGDVDDLLESDDGLDEIDVSSTEAAVERVAIDHSGPLPSYAPIDDDEFEEDVLAIDDDEVESAAEHDVVRVPTPAPVYARESMIDAAEVLEDDELADEDEESDEDEIPEDALDAPLHVEPYSRPPMSSEPPTDRDALGLDSYREEADEPVTQPHLEDPHLASIVSTRPGPEPNLEPEGDPHIGDVVLGEVRGLEDLPPEGQVSLVRQVHIEQLSTEEEVSAFGLALVLKGAVSVMPTIADVACARAAKGDIVWSEGHVEDGVALRLVAAENGTEVATWDASVLHEAVHDMPWVVDDLKTLADRYQALAGVAMGPMGERLDDSLRSMVTDRCEVKRFLPGEELVEKGKPVGGMFIVAAGRVEIADDDDVKQELGSGEFLFASQVLAGGAAPHSARAGQGGALVLFAGRSSAHELLVSVPPLLEIFAG